MNRNFLEKVGRCELRSQAGEGAKVYGTIQKFMRFKIPE